MDHDVAHFTFELEHDNTNKMTCAINEDSGLSGHPPSLIRVWVANDLNFHQSDSEDWPDWAVLMSSLGAQVICWFCCAADYFITKPASLFLITSASYEHCCL